MFDYNSDYGAPDRCVLIETGTQIFNRVVE